MRWADVGSISPDTPVSPDGRERPPHGHGEGQLNERQGGGGGRCRVVHLREQLLRLNAHTTGHRLLRDAIFPGGARLRHIPDPAATTAIAAETAEVVGIALKHSVVSERFTGTATLTRSSAAAIQKVAAPPPEMPVTPMRSGSTSGRVSR